MKKSGPVKNWQSKFIDFHLRCDGLMVSVHTVSYKLRRVGFEGRPKWLLRRPSLDVWKLYHAGKEIILWENFDLSHEILLKRVGPDLDIRSLFKEPLAQILLAILIKMVICKVKKSFCANF